MSASDDSDRAHPPAPSRKREGEASAALRDAAAHLSGVSETPRLDAELLMAHALGVERNRMLLDPSRFAVPGGFEAMVARRLAHEPVAYIVGYRDFWTIRLAVGPGVLVPRPDSETLIEAAIAHFGARAADHPRSWHGSGHAAPCRARRMARSARPGRRRERARARLCARQCRPAGPGGSRDIPGRRLGAGDRRPVRPDPVQPALYRGKRNADAGRRGA